MFFIEKIYSVKKKVGKLYKDYLTEEGKYTSLLPDKIYLKKLYKKRVGKELDLKNPTTYTEKLNWLNLYDRRPEYTIMADKYAVRKYVAEKIGEEYLVELLGVWDSVEQIDFSSLPDKFVLKCNHDNGVIICTDKKTFDIEKAKKELQWHLERDYYKKCREWPYKNIPRKIICEKYMENDTGKLLIEYKVFCFNGKIKFTQVITDRFTDSGTTFDNYDFSWNYMDMYQGDHCNQKGDIYEKPIFLDDIYAISEKLSKGISHIRIDFNIWNDKIYFGELTFFDSGGFDEFQPEKWAIELGNWIELPKKRRG